ncbi:14843_t:CDS:1 [Dentiscutata erythropus]|uniref:14843_t:CDS:1 n=1 Tax=Dentiscutata erythropus TaxID=1348616 RepID=A0A9N9EUE1_9GLOM|nr:14843_t:CDS:1 [Dentiscutata erythropus]
MRLKYQIELLDNWVVAKKHKLILSVYAILNIQDNKYEHTNMIIYLGPMFIRICSDKYDSSTAYSYRKDFDNLIGEKQLCNYTTTIDEQLKSIVVILSNSGSDENS